MKTVVDLTEELKKYFLEKDTAAKQAVEANIAPVEADASSASRAYVVGEQLFLNDVLYDVTSPISVGDAIVVNTNITAANKLSADIKSKIDDLYSKNQTLTNQANDMVNVLGAKNFVDIEDFSLSKSNARTKSINKSDIRGEIPDKDVILSFTVSNSTLTVDGACFDVYDTNNTRIDRAQFREDGQYSVRFNGANFRNLYIFISSTDIDSAACTISNIMIRLASITDDTYAPYTKTNQQLTDDSVTWDDLSEVGAVNYLPNTATSQTIYGVAYTVNSDGSITVDGTATGGNASLVVNMTTYLKKGTYKLTGAPKGYNTITRLAITRGTPSSVFDNGNGATFTLTEDATNAIYVQAIVWEGKTVSNLTFKPMITVASYNGDYVPYAKSNKELTEDVIRFDSEAVKIVDSGLINANSSYSFTCTNYEGYRLSIYSLDTDSIGMVVLFGKHPSVGDIKYSIFHCENRVSNAPQISVSGSTLTITTTNINCYYTIERIRNT